MSDTRLILGICPKCGKKLQIPAELHRFSCLYCGSWLHVEIKRKYINIILRFYQ